MLNILLVEDSADDAELISRQIKKEGLAGNIRQVHTRGGFVEALHQKNWDVVLADFSLPQFTATDVLEILKQKEIRTPLILVTGTLSEELAVEFIKRGGDDFLLKSSLKRLGHSIRNAIERRALERERYRTQAALIESEERFRLVVEGVQDFSICMLDPEGEVLTWNAGGERIFGYSANEAISRHFSILYDGHSAKTPAPTAQLQAAITNGRFESEGEMLRAGGDRFLANVIITPLRTDGNRLRGFSHVVRDITEKRRVEEALKSSHGQLRSLAGKLQSLRESEAIRIAREIHDDLGQSLTAIKIELSRVTDKLNAKGEPLGAKLQATVDLTNSTIQSVQRIVTELRPRLLDELGLAEAIKWQVGEFQKRTGIPCQFRNRASDKVFPGEISTAVFRILQETLTNVARHAHATRVAIILWTASNEVRLTVRDNGRGLGEKLQNSSSLGLVGMRERAMLLGGSFEIKGLPETGTKISVSIPLEQA